MSEPPPSDVSPNPPPRAPEPLTDLLRRLFGERAVPDIALPGHDELERDEVDAGTTRSFGRYELRGELARGGMGAILRVFDKDLRRSLAMKVILGRGEAASDGTPAVDEVQLARFLEEAQVTGQLDHPSVVPVHELGIDPAGRVYFTMKLVKGETLRDVFDKVKLGRDGWSRTRALGVLLKVCEAMAYAHAKGVIHRDLKPANVMVGRYGEVYVMDWGLARVLGEEDKKDVRIRPPAGLTSEVRSPRAEHRGDTPDSPLYTMDGDVVGTPAYMPPEQAAGDVARMGPHSDVYAVGAMLYHLLAGHMPYLPQGARAHNYAVWQRVQEGPPAPIAQVAADAPAEIVAICERAMAREIGKRYRDMEELASDLRAFLEGRVVAAYETGTWAETRKWVQRNRGLAASLLAVVLVLAAGLAVSWALTGEAEHQARIAEDQRKAAKRQAGIADELRVLAQQNEQRAKESAESALRAKAVAEENARRADESKLAAEENEALARERQAEAEAARKEARWSSYLASLQAADAALRLGEAANLARRLRDAPEEFRGWEWRHLDAVRDTSLLVLGPPVEVSEPYADGDHEPTRSTRGGRATAKRPEPPPMVTTAAFSPDGRRVLAGYWDGGSQVLDSWTGGSVAALPRHRGRVMACAFSPSGSLALTCSADATARLSDPATGAELAVLRGHTSALVACAFSSDGRRVLTASFDQTARIWSTADGSEVLAFRGHRKELTACALSPDGTRALTGSEDGTARLWDTADGTELVVLRGVGDVRACSFSADGRRFLAGFANGEVRVGTTSAGDESIVLSGRSGLNICAFSPDGDRVAVVSAGGFVVIHDATTAAKVVELREDAEWIKALAWSPDGTRIGTAGMDGAARVWPAAGGEPIAVLRGHTDWLDHCAFSPEGDRILTIARDGSARMWDATRAPGARLPYVAAVVACRFDPEGRRLLTSAHDGTSRLWDLDTATQLAAFRPRAIPTSACSFSPDGSRVLCGARDGSAILWDVATTAELWTSRGHAGPVDACAFRSDGTRILTASADGTARLWDASTGAELAALLGHDKGITSGVFSPDGTRVLTGSWDRTARVWNADDGEEILVLAGHRQAIRACAFSPDGTRILTCSSDGTARLWDATDGRELASLGSFDWSLRSSGRKNLTQGAFTRDGRRIVTAAFDGSVELWDASRGTSVATLSGHFGRVTDLRLQPHGDRIFTAADDGTIRVWDPERGAELAVLRGEGRYFDCLDLGPDGTRVAAVEGGGFVRLWDSVPYRERSAARRRREAAAAAGRTALSAALEGSQDLLEVARRLRSEGSLEPAVRDAALDALLLQVDAVRQEIEAFGVELAAGNRSPEDVSLASPVHPLFLEHARRVAARLRETPDWLHDVARRVVASAEAEPAAQRAALQAVREARRLAPAHPWCPTTLGMALYRCGDYEAAISALEPRRGPEEAPADLIFLAMARHRIGETDAARELLAELRQAIAIDGSETAETARLRREAEALVEPVEFPRWDK